MRSLESQAIWAEIRRRQQDLVREHGGCPSSLVFGKAVESVIEDMTARDATPTEYREQLEAERSAEAVNKALEDA